MTAELKRALADRERLAGNWISIGDPSLSEVSAELGFDFVLVDTEHTTMCLETVANHARAVDATDEPTGTLVRVPDADPARLKRVLDIGVDGVMVPMVETVEQAASVVESVRYPPEGIRGIAGGRASRYGLDIHEYVHSANDDVVTVVQIETETGLENAEDIARVEGVDALFVGPADLSGTLDVFGQWDDESFVDAIHGVVAAADSADTAVGTLTVDPDDIEPRVEQGFDFLIVGKDLSSFASASQEAMGRFESAIDGERATLSPDQE